MTLKHSGMMAIVMQTTEAQNKEVSPWCRCSSEADAGRQNINRKHQNIGEYTRSQLNKTSIEVGQAVL